MADISKINPNGTEYNLKDATARSAIENTNENIQSSITVPKASVVTVTDAAAINAEDITVDITPVQDLHGYDRPWAGGAGKNKLPLTVEGIKAANTSGTWSGNVYTLNSVTFTLMLDADNNVIGVKVNGTASANANFVLYPYVSGGIASGSYKMNGCPAGGATDGSTYYLGFYIPNKSKYNFGGGDTSVTIDGIEGAGSNVFIHANAGYTCNNLMFYPMIRLASETDATFAPYSNICPIEGRTGAELTQKDAATNPTVTRIYSTDFGETVHGGKWHVTAGGTDKTHANIANYNGETINEPWLSSLDEYVAGATPTTGAQVVYPLTTPTTISTPKQNVPMLKGINTVYADCGDVSLKYQPDNVIGELKGRDEAIWDAFKANDWSGIYGAVSSSTYQFVFNLYRRGGLVGISSFNFGSWLTCPVGSGEETLQIPIISKYIPKNKAYFKFRHVSGNGAVVITLQTDGYVVFSWNITVAMTGDEASAGWLLEWNDVQLARDLF